MFVPASMITHCATRVRSTVKECARHSDNLCLHLSYTREDVWVKWVAPCKISIYLATKKVTWNTKYQPPQISKFWHTHDTLNLKRQKQEFLVKCINIQPWQLVLGMPKSRDVYKDAYLHQELGQFFIAPIDCTGHTSVLPLHLICNDRNLCFSQRNMKERATSFLKSNVDRK